MAIARVQASPTRDTIAFAAARPETTALSMVAGNPV
jgi:hypothetical protein